MKGIDVAKWNEIKNYGAVKSAGVEFAIVKVINKSNQPDERLERHLNGFAKADIPVIAGYNYLYATTEAAAIQAAQACVRTAAGRIPMLYADVEDVALKRLPKAQLTRLLKAYQGVVESAGLQFGIYCSLDWYKNVLDVKDLPVPYWIARYGKNNGRLEERYKPAIAHQLNGWQYSSKGRYPGITGDVDVNEWYAAIEGAGAAENAKPEGYGRDRFLKDMAAALHLTGMDAGSILNKTVTISTKKNRKHACVTPLERYLKAQGLYQGSVEADAGRTPVFGNGMAKATAMYQSMVVGQKRPDSIWTKRAASYQTALGLR